MQYLAVLGRLPKLSLAELESLYSDVKMISDTLATFTAKESPSITRLGGTMKLARLLDNSPLEYLQNLPEGKITLGISDYSPRTKTYEVRKEAMKLKKILARHGRSVRILDNKTAVLSTATCHHNKLGIKPLRVELLRFNNTWYLGLGVQNITAYARRDQARPARDAKVGMLPPKLAQILLNLCGNLPSEARILDPFCGTGVLLQEAYLMGYRPYGTDVSARMIEYSRKNLQWLKSDDLTIGDLAVGDAMSFTWEQPIDAVACETYLGPPMSQPPVDIKLKTAQTECRQIILGFLKNSAPQLKSGTPLAIAVPAWRRPNGDYARLNILDEIANLSYNVMKFKHSSQDDLLYFREGQVVAREIIVLRKK